MLCKACTDIIEKYPMISKANGRLKILAKIQVHIVLWILMFFYFVFAPDLFTFVFTRNGKPLQIDGDLPTESNRIHLVIENLVPYVKDGENLYELIGWSFMLPEEGISSDLLVPEIALVSDQRNYFFSARTEFRKPEIPSKFADIDINYDTLGLSVLIAEDAIKPGKYRIAVIF